LQAIPAVLSAVHVTGDVDYEFRLACRDVADLGAALTVRHVTDVRTFVAIDGGMSDNPRERRRKPGAWPCGQGAPSRVVTGNGGSIGNGGAVRVASRPGSTQPMTPAGAESSRRAYPAGHMIGVTVMTGPAPMPGGSSAVLRT